MDSLMAQLAKERRARLAAAAVQAAVAAAAPAPQPAPAAAPAVAPAVSAGVDASVFFVDDSPAKPAPESGDSARSSAGPIKRAFDATATTAASAASNPATVDEEGGQPKKRRKVLDKVAEPWACAKCTFLNESPCSTCEVCGAPRPQPVARLTRVKVLTWNVSQSEASCSAPGDWTPKRQRDAMRDTILAHDPDIICLQEAPDVDWWGRIGLTDYTCPGAARSHSGFTLLLLRVALAGNTRSEAVVLPNSPAVELLLSLGDGSDGQGGGGEGSDDGGGARTSSRHLCLSSFHLSPFKEGESERLDEMRDIVRWCEADGGGSGGGGGGGGGSGCNALLCGDSNMRAPEWKNFKALPGAGAGAGAVSTGAGASAGGGGALAALFGAKGTAKGKAKGAQAREPKAAAGAKAKAGGMADAWVEAGSDPKTKFTWDSRTNLFHEGGFAFTAQFDRVFTLGGALKARSFRLVGSEPASAAPGHFLSDHFGIVAEFDVV